MKALKASDIRVGQHLNFFMNGGLTVMHGIVESINRKTVTFLSGVKSYTVKYINITPIRLSNEWIKSFGFQYDTVMYWIELKDKWGDKLKIGLSIQVDGMYLVHFAYFNNIITVVEFVHELQNIITDLTGTELKIK